MACGSPIVACDRPALRPWVVHGETGELTDPEDSATIADRLIAILTESGPTKAHLHQTGPAWIRERADREVCLDSLERIFKKATEQKGHGHRRTLRNFLKI
jgi:glycosyltransferase involved in cell wall biosynthesis